VGAVSQGKASTSCYAVHWAVGCAVPLKAKRLSEACGLMQIAEKINQIDGYELSGATGGEQRRKGAQCRRKGSTVPHDSVP